jgi:hypothetical protein
MAKKKVKKKKGGGRYGKVGGYKGVKKSTAKNLASGVYQTEMRELQGQQRNLDRDTRQSVNEAENQYARAKGDLAHVYGETGKYIDTQKAATAAEYAAGEDRTVQATAALKSQLEGLYSGATGGAESELERLGISDAGNYQGILSDALNAQSVASQSGENARSTMNQSGTNAGALMSLLAGMNQGSYTSSAGQILNARNDAISKAKDEQYNQTRKIRDAMVQAKKSRKDVYLQLLQQLQQTGWSQYLQNQQLKLQRKQVNKK